MFNKERIYYYILGLLVVIFVLIQIFKPKPLNWTENFSADSKIPYGGYLIHEYLPSLFPGQDIIENRGPLFHFADTLSGNKNWIFINKSFGLDEFETDILLSQIEKGSHVLIAARTFSNAFKDSLNISTKFNYPSLKNGAILDDDTARVFFTNPILKSSNGYSYYKSTTQTYFSSIDTSQHVKRLGMNEEGQTNFLMIKIGKGNLYLHSNPTLFTNYFVRNKKGAEYMANVLSYFPEQPLVWDEYYKDVNRRSGSVVRYIVSEENLRRAWILSIAGLLLFMLFRAKRKQRIIPEIKRPKNSSIEFAKTIGDLYLEKGHHKMIADKKIRYFYDYLRSNLSLDLEEKSEQTIHDIASRSGLKDTEVKHLMNLIQSLKPKESISPKELKLLTDQIDQFYKKSQR
ncbi:MAG: DUF4350 domain-containing protein [Gracilimonas sp.]|nr:DUF4350 domain-containing protein [Gracilimonas sp.]